MAVLCVAVPGQWLETLLRLVTRLHRRCVSLGAKHGFHFHQACRERLDLLPLRLDLPCLFLHSLSSMALM